MAERKHLFGSTEKSDFILNMSEQGAKKLCGVYTIIAMILVAVSALPYYFTQNVFDYSETVAGIEVTHYWNEKLIYLLMVFTVAAGMGGFLIFLVGQMKKEIVLEKNKSLLLLVVFLLASVVTSLIANSIQFAIYGYIYRAEGLLSVLAYTGFFAMAMAVTADNWRTKISDVLVGIGAVNAVVGILQVFTDVIPNYFASDSEKSTIAAMLSSYKTHDPYATGLAVTPFALAALLTVCFAVALSGVVFDSCKIRKVLYSLGGAVMVVGAVYTQVIPAIIGIGVAAFIVLVVAIIKGVKSKGSSFIIAGISGAAVVGIIFGIFAATGNMKFDDERIMITDFRDRLEISEYTREDDSFIYSYLWDDGMYIVEQNPLSGVALDNWGTMFDAGSLLDRTYNEYIDMAVTRGIPCLAIYLIFLIVTLRKAFKAVSNFVKDENNWVAVAVTSAIIAYMVQAFFNISTTSNSPFFWLCIGLVWSYTAKAGLKKAK